MWNIGRELGVVALDCQRIGHVYFCRIADYIQDPLCFELQSLTFEEVEISMLEMLKDLKYFEESEV